MDSLGSRIRALRLSKQFTQMELSRLLHISNTTLSQYENDLRIPDDATKVKIANIFGVTVDYLLGNSAKKVATESDLERYGILPVKLKKFRVLGEIACGKPIYADEDRETTVLADEDIDADFCLYARGDSMIGARILDGDIVFIKAQDIVNNGEIAAVIIGDEATLKRVYYDPAHAKLVLSAENPAYAPLVYVGEELNDIRILGRAVAFQSAIK